MKLVVDTSGLIHFLQKQPQAVAAFAQAERILVPVIALGEWLTGIQAQAGSSRKALLVQELLSRPRAALLPIDGDTPTYYAHLHSHLRRKGTPIPTNDLWIAACAMQAGGKLLTSDAHFLRLPQIILDFIDA